MGRAATRSQERGTASNIFGAKSVPMPGFMEPCHATLRDNVPPGDRWIHEIKYDGYRVQGHKSRERVILYTRNGYDWTDRFGPIASSIAKLPVNQAIFDGEIISTDKNGAPDFAALQEDLARGRGDRLVYYIFDLLYLDGFDIRGAPLVERKRLLGELLSETRRGPILFSEHIDGNGQKMFENACAMGLEGIVSKQRNAPYRSGRSESWIKAKCAKTGDYPIVAFVEKLGATPRRVASLYVGRRENGRLLYAGKARSGYTETSARRLRELLDPHIRKTSPLDVPVKKPKATWVEPVVDAEIEYSTITGDGLLREAVYRGVRDDLEPAPPKVSSEQRKQSTTKRKESGKPHIGVPRDNILQLLPDAVAPSKEELAAYWRRVGKRALEYLGRRPLKLVRHTHHTIFYHKGKLPPVPSSVHQLKIQKREGGEGTRLWVDSIEGLLGLVEIGAVEIHPWNAAVDDLEHPDTLVLDLDPGHGVEWQFVIDTALRLKEMLDDEGLESWPKLTGGKGIHLMMPIEPDLTHNEARGYAKSVAQRIADTDPKRYLVSSDPGQRSGKIFIDYLRNGRGNTAIGTYSPRVRYGFPIAAPATWRQVKNGIRPDAFTMKNPPKR